MTHTPNRRPGYTLIELIVVISIAVVLLTLVVGFGPSLMKSNQINRSASQMQGWLAVAKQRAYRDKIMSGIRLLDSGGGVCREIQYIEQPDDITGNCNVGGAGNTTVTLLSPVPDLTSGVSQPAVQVNYDFIIFGMEGTVPPCGHLISGASGTTNLTIGTGASGPLNGTFFRIRRGFRPTVGESKLRLPVDTVIDLSSGKSIPDMTTAANRDIVFGPTGGLVATNGSARVMLWVRGEQAGGEEFLVTVYARTGAIAVHPVAPGADPYAYTTDGRASGL